MTADCKGKVIYILCTTAKSSKLEKGTAVLNYLSSRSLKALQNSVSGP